MDPNKGPMRPSDVSLCIVAQHCGLEAQLDELSRVAKTLARGGPKALSRALQLTRTLYNDLQHHIRFEGTMLVPAFLNADAWGEIRAGELLKRLRQRRHQLKDLRESFASPQPGTLGAGIDAFIVERRADMADSERQNAGILRDDVHGIDVEGG